MLNCEEQGALLKELLNLKYCVVAVGLGREPHGVRRLEGRMEFCRMWAEAQKGKAFFATAENHSCLPGEFHLGLRDEAVKEQVCRFWVEDVYAYSPTAVKKYVAGLMHLPHEKASVICLAPLERAVFQPDLVLVRCNPKQAMLLLWSYAYDTGEVVQGETGNAMCQTLVVKPYLQNKPSFSTGDPGGTHGVGLLSGELMVSVPYSLFKNMITALQHHIKDWKSENSLK